MKRKLRMGMVGGGRDAFIGAVHRMAAGLDGRFELVCGALSADPKKALDSGQDLGLAEDRCYGSWQEMLAGETRRAASERIDVVSIVTPNHVHVPVATAALQAGFHVICDKPLGVSLKEARALGRVVDVADKLFALTHNYSGYPMVKQARDMVARGKLGKIRKVVVEYPQGWLATRLEETGQKQASWRTDPKRAGAAGCMGDIGTHAHHLAEYITGLRVEELCAELTTFVPGRKLDDDGNVLLRLEGGAKGVLHASQISIDEENGLNIRVYGEKGGLEWHQQEPNTLTLKWPDRGRETLRPGANYAGRLCKAAMRCTRLPAGHPEGYIEAFANLYRDFADLIAAHDGGRKPPADADVPGIEAGIRGMAFIEACVASSKKGRWVAFPKV